MNLAHRWLVLAVLFLALTLSARADEVRLSVEGGVYMVPVRVNGVVSVNFVLDSGASECQIPAEVYQRLVQSGGLTPADLLEPASYTLADGRTVTRQRVRLRRVQVGNTVIADVSSSVGDMGSPALFGQSALGKLPHWRIDNRRGVLVLGEGAAPPAPRTPQGGLRPATPPAARVPDSGPAECARGFFLAVANRSYGTAWNLLTAHSKNSIVRLVAEDEGLDPMMVRSLFEANDPSVQEGFWEAFRDSSGAGGIVGQGFVTQTVVGNGARVQVGGSGQLLQVFRENGVWKFGLLETFPL